IAWTYSQRAVCGHTGSQEVWRSTNLTAFSAFGKLPPFRGARKCRRPPRADLHGEAAAAHISSGESTRTVGAGSTGPAVRTRVTASTAAFDLFRGGCRVRARSGSSTAPRLPRSSGTPRVGPPPLPRGEGAPRARPPLPQHLRAPGQSARGGSP